MSRRLFSDADDEILKAKYQDMTNKELVQLFNGTFSAKQIKYRAKALHLKKTKEVVSRAIIRGSLEEWEEEILRKHYQKMGTVECQKLLSHRSLQQIRYKAKRLGLTMDYDVFCVQQAHGPKHHTEETKQRMSESHQDIVKSEEWKKRIGEAQLGDKHWNWKGGRSFKEYGDEFNIHLKTKIRKRDSYQCQRCKRKPSWKRLHIHHIDYDKSNNAESNLITLCIDCHNRHHNQLSEQEQRLEQVYFIECLGLPKLDLINSNVDIITA